jgi:hypothetical protein
MQMLKVLAGDLSATFTIDGQHLGRYLDRRKSVVRSLCDQLLLHDKIFIPTQDYLTAAGLIRLLGERNFLTLLEEERIGFIRLRGDFGYVRGTGVDGRLLAMQDPTGTQSPSTVGRGAQRVDEAAFERAAKQRAVGALTRLRTAAERPVNRVIADQGVSPSIGVRAKARPAIITRMLDHAGAHRLQFNIATAREEISLSVDRRGPGAPLPERFRFGDTPR